MSEETTGSGKSRAVHQTPTLINQLAAGLRANLPARIGSYVLAAAVAIVIAWPVALRVAPWCGAGGAHFAQLYQPDHLSDEQFQPPDLRHWLGTDLHGRDLLSRILYGAQISLLVGIVGTAVSLVIGVLWGTIAGYAGGRVDELMMRAVDILYSLPSIIFVIVLFTTFEGQLKRWTAATGATTVEKSAHLLFLVFGLGAVSWLTMARIVRGQVLTLRQMAFVEASRALGAGPMRILLRHIIPNTLGVIIVYLTLTVPAVIMYESFLSYLGLGIQPPMASLGSLISEGAEQLNPIRIYWWLILFPGGCLVTMLLALSFVADGLRDAWEPGKQGETRQT